MGLDAHHNIGRLDAYHQIVISHLFYHVHLVHGALNQAFRRHAFILFYQRLLKRAAVYADADRHLVFLCLIHHCLYAFSGPDISRVDPDLVCAILNCRNCQAIVKMNIRHQWDMNLLLDLCKRLRCLHRRNRAANNLAACPFQFQNLGHRRLHILRPGIRHRLDGNRAPPAYAHISYPNLFRLVSKHWLYPFHNTVSCEQ